MLTIPRLVISAPRGRAGKTTLTVGLAAALTRRGLRIQPFKKGPDYIDPGWLGEAAGRPCRNLDLFFSSPDRLLTGFAHACQNADLALIEGVHGLFDGLEVDGAENTTAAVARLLEAPVILAVDADRMGGSVAALVRGFRDFDPRVRVAGVIVNRVGNSRHRAKLAAAISRYTDLPLLGALPRDPALAIPDRHLGLVPKDEESLLLYAIDAVRRAVEEAVDLDAVLELARSASPIPVPHEPLQVSSPPQVELGVAWDRAFTFYYPENLEALRAAGARLIPIDTLADRSLPDVDGLYLGGGFPEIFLEDLEANEGLRRDLRAAIADGLPVYAECGGLMYLSRRIIWNGRSASMIGALPCDIEVADRPQGHGYVEFEVTGRNPYLPTGARLRGHEFHYSRVVNLGPVDFAYRLTRGQGVGGGRDGLVVGNILAAYTHVHALSAPGWAEGFVASARVYRKRRVHALPPFRAFSPTGERIGGEEVERSARVTGSLVRRS